MMAWTISVEARVFQVGSITAVKEGNGGRTLHGFDVIGINGRPLVTFNYETEEEAAAAREQMRQQVVRAKTIREVRDRLNRER